MKPVRWGVLGISSHFVKKVLLPLLKSPLVELYAISSRSAEKAKNTAFRFGIPVWYSSYDDLLRDESIEAVYIPLPNHLHTPWIKKAAKAGKHILCEKPMALTAQQVSESIDCARKNGVELMEAFMYRFHPQWDRTFELVQVGEIGRVLSICTISTTNVTDPKNIRNSWEMGGGALLDIACYVISLSRFILEREPKRVVSLVKRDPGYKTDVLSSGILDFEDAQSIFFVATQVPFYQRVDIHGTDGYITLKTPFNTYPDVCSPLVVATKYGIREIQTGPANHFALEFEAFSKAVRERSTMAIPPQDALYNLKVLDALFGSEKSGKWENV